MRTAHLAALAAAAVMGGSAITVTGHASAARGGSGHATSASGSGGRASATPGRGGSSTGGTGAACGGLDLIIAVTQLPLHANGLNNLGGGQLQLGNALGGLNNLGAPVGASAGGGSMRTSQGITTLSGGRGADDGADSGNAACGNAGDGGDGSRGGRARGGRGGAAGSAVARGGTARSRHSD
ncbi:MAG TPA: hypothetical protein VF112_06215 [Candidatus Dormibacteraeota bacterium]